MNAGYVQTWNWDPMDTELEVLSCKNSSHALHVPSLYQVMLSPVHYVHTYGTARELTIILRMRHGQNVIIPSRSAWSPKLSDAHIANIIYKASRELGSCSHPNGEGFRLLWSFHMVVCVHNVLNIIILHMIPIIIIIIIFFFFIIFIDDNIMKMTMLLD